MTPPQPLPPPSARCLPIGALLLLPLAGCALAKGYDTGVEADGDCEIRSNPIKFGDDITFNVADGRSHIKFQIIVLENDCVIPASDWAMSCPMVDPDLSSRTGGFRLQPDKDVTMDLYLTTLLESGTSYSCGLTYDGGVADTLSLIAP